MRATSQAVGSSDGSEDVVVDDPKRHPSPTPDRSRGDVLGELPGLRTNNPEMAAMLERARAFADLDEIVLIQGETGSGKEVLARAMHQASARAKRSLVTVDCGAVPESLVEAELFGYERGSFTGADKSYCGRIESAAGATLFIDEVNSIPLSMQARLLGFLDRRQFTRIGKPTPVRVDVKIIAATNVPLEALVKSGRMRSDFYHRLNVLRLVVPPLRSRLEDVHLIAEAFLARDTLANRWRVSRLSADVLEQLRRHDWPGNVRELLNVLRRSVIFGARGNTLVRLDTVSGRPLIEPSVSAAIDRPPPMKLRAWIRECEREYLLELRRRYQTMAECVLASGVPERTLYRKMHALCDG